MPVNSIRRKDRRYVFLFFCREFTKTFDAIFRLEEIHGSLKISPIYLKKINQWLHNDEELLQQIKNQVIRTRNRSITYNEYFLSENH